MATALFTPQSPLGQFVNLPQSGGGGGGIADGASSAQFGPGYMGMASPWSDAQVPSPECGKVLAGTGTPGDISLSQGRSFESNFPAHRMDAQSGGRRKNRSRKQRMNRITRKNRKDNRKASRQNNRRANNRKNSRKNSRRNNRKQRGGAATDGGYGTPQQYFNPSMTSTRTESDTTSMSSAPTPEFVRPTMFATVPANYDAISGVGAVPHSMVGGRRSLKQQRGGFEASMGHLVSSAMMAASPVMAGGRRSPRSQKKKTHRRRK